jgi:hypothetical protein
LFHEDSLDIKSLLLRIAKGDETAFEALFHEFTPRLLPFAAIDAAIHSILQKITG